METVAYTQGKITITFVNIAKSKEDNPLLEKIYLKKIGLVHIDKNRYIWAVFRGKKFINFTNQEPSVSEAELYL